MFIIAGKRLLKISVAYVSLTLFVWGFRFSYKEYEKSGWWSDTGPNCSTLPSTGKKIVTLNNPTWKSLELDWDDGEEPETVIEIKLEKKQDKVKNLGENVVEFKPNDKK